MSINDIFTKGLDVYDALDLLGPVAVYVLGMTVYAIFVFKFYRFVASRDMFHLDLTKYEQSRFRGLQTMLHLVLYVVKYIIIFPIFAFFWFAVMTLILAFLSKGQTFSETLLIALATVSAIRATSYYNEDLSRDLAKILPFAVLGIFLIDASFFTVSESLEVLKDARFYSENILYYLTFLIVLEFALRLLKRGVMLISDVKKQVLKSSEPDPSSSVEEPPGVEN